MTHCMSENQGGGCQGDVLLWVCFEFSFFGIVCDNLPCSLLSSFVVFESVLSDSFLVVLFAIYKNSLSIGFDISHITSYVEMLCAHHMDSLHNGNGKW